MAKKTNKKNGKQPDIKAKSGIFRIAAWKTTKVIPVDEEKNPYGIEKEYKQINVCLSIGQRKDGQWENVRAWFPSSQLIKLEDAIDDFKPKLRELINSLEKQLEEEVE